MSNSSLVDYVKISPNSNIRQNSIKKITIHHMAGNLSVETCGNVFQNVEASSNYGIDSDGRVGLYVDEDRRSWASANPANDHQAVTVEVANDGGAPDWHVSDVALAKLIDLCVDICQRNNIESLNYTGDTSGNLTRHNMFMNTTCPGPYLQSKFPYIADEVNKRLQNINNEPVNNESEDDNKIMIEMRNIQKGDIGDDVRIAMLILKDRGYYKGDIWSEDKLFGDKMEAAVIQAQKDNGFGADGVIGYQMWPWLLKK
jgi:hypothetical protein